MGDNKQQPQRTYLIDTTPTHVNRREGATYLADRAIDDEIAAARGYRFISQGNHGDPIAAKSGIGSKYFEDGGSAIAIPLYALPEHDERAGETAEPNLVQFRVEDPDSLPGSLSGRRFLLPKGAERGDSPRRNPLDVNPFPTNLAYVRDVGVPLFITEGAPKGDAVISASQREGVAVGVATVTGVDMPVLGGEGGDADGLHPRTIGSNIWRPLLKHRVVILGFDADMWTKPQVASALRKLAVLLTEQRNTEVRVLVLDPAGPKGVDDYLRWAESKGERKPLSKLLRAAKRFDLVEKDLIRRGVLSPRPKPRPLADIDLDRAKEQWFSDLDDEVSDEIVWSLDLAGNSVLRARSDAAKDALGGWHLYPEDGIREFVCYGDEPEAKRIVAALATSDLDRFDRGDLLAHDRDDLLAELSIGSSVDLDVIDRGATLEHAIKEVRGGRAPGFSFLLDSDGRTELRAEVASKESAHGIWEVTYNNEGVPVGRKRLLPYVPVQGGELFYRQVDFNNRYLDDEERTGFSIRAVFAGGHVRVARGVPVAATTSAVSAVTAFRKAGIRVQSPVGFDEREAFERCLNLVGFDEATAGAMYSRLGYVNAAGRGESRNYVYATLSGGIDAEGIREDVIASNKPDVRKRGAGLSDWTRRVEFTRFATDKELAELPRIIAEFIACAPVEITLPVAAQMLGSLFPRGKQNPSIFVYGLPKSNKTGVVSAFASAFVDWRGEREEHRSASVFSDSKAAVGNLGAFAGHLPFIVDDLVETKDPAQIEAQAALVDAAITAAYEGVSGGRAEIDGSLRDNVPHVESPIFTAETRDPIANSRQSRAIMCEVEKGDVDLQALDAWRDAWIATGKLNRIMASIIRVVIREMNELGDLAGHADTAIGPLPLNGSTDTLRRLNGWDDSREANNVARLLAGLWHALNAGFMAISEDEKALRESYVEAQKPLNSRLLFGESASALVASQRESIVAMNPARGFLDHVAELIAGGGAYLLDPAGDIPRGADRYGYRRHTFRGETTWQTRGNAIEAGRLSKDGECVFLHASFVRRVREQLFGKTMSTESFDEAMNEFMPEKFQGKGGQMTSGVILQDDRKRNLALRGHVIFLEAFGLEPEGDAKYAPRTEKPE
ncbi:DUF3854 domain-containing protein [Microbacterium sp. GXF6406]